MAVAKATAVGGFILGGVALGVCSLLMFASLHFFKKSAHAVVIFSDSVAGLAIGSPVTFRGVQIGQVEAMKVQFSAGDHAPVIPVHLDLDPAKVAWTDRAPGAGGWDIGDAVKSGLRAQLSPQSLITGQMSVELDLHPRSPAVVMQSIDGIPEIPTIPSDAQLLKDEVLGLNLPDLGAKTRAALASLQRTLDQVAAQIGPITADLHLTLKTAHAAIRDVQEDSHRTLTDLDELARSTRLQVDANGKDLSALLKTSELTMARAQAVLGSIDEMTAPQSEVRADLEASLRDLAAATSSLREFTHNLERNPAGTLLRRSSP